MIENTFPRLQHALNGTWQLQPGEKTTPPSKWDHEAPVPALVDVATPKYDWASHEYHWYRHCFTLPNDFQRELVFLKIDQAMFGTAVWLNGVSLGEDMACYTSQEYALSKLINYENENELLIRVGAKSTLPPESAVGKDQEKTEFIPGIWGDVKLCFSGNPRVKLVQMIPHLATATAEARVTLQNFSAENQKVKLATKVIEKKSGRQVSAEIISPTILASNAEVMVTVFLEIAPLRLWSPDDPFLYELITTLYQHDQAVDDLHTVFGMREFKVVGADFYFNDKRIFLKGGNIAFHRFLSDRERGTLPWDEAWIKRLLIDIPKAHHFNFFRNHLGQMYNRWYDLADEYGMLLQNEWPFWTTTGTKEQITQEFTRWLQDNWNHPSIIIWDALNESSDEIVQKEIVPEMKKLDPTRPWESVDFVEEHPYIYSLGPVLNDRKLGFTRALDEIEQASTPSMINEFLWWWLDSTGKPTSLTEEVVERWLGRDYSPEELFQRQNFLAQELVELFRRMRVDAIQPFVYLSNNRGPTGHWFLGNIKALKPKPILSVLKNVFAPFGVSLELWDRHFFAGERRTLRLFVFNDTPEAKTSVVRYGVVNDSDLWVSSNFAHLRVEGGGCSILPIEIAFPHIPGTYHVKAELQNENNPATLAHSRKTAQVFAPPEVPEKLRLARLVLFDSHYGLAQFLNSREVPFEDFAEATLKDQQALIVAAGMSRDRRYRDRLAEISRFAYAGHTVVIIEPEFGLEGKETIPVLNDLNLAIEKRVDADKGGYDSYVFVEDHSHPLWNGLTKAHLKMFNGALGGEMVSQHNVIPSASHTVLARCGLRLNVIAVTEIAVGIGKIIISRLQTRGRLMHHENSNNLYDRRVDPVAQQYLLNLLAYAISSH